MNARKQEITKPQVDYSSVAKEQLHQRIIDNYYLAECVGNTSKAGANYLQTADSMLRELQSRLDNNN